MLLILVACLIWLPSLIGLGSPIAEKLRQMTGTAMSSSAIHTAVCGLVGMFVASTFAAGANFFCGVYPFFSSAILILGWAIFIRHHRRWTRLPRRVWPIVVSIFVVVALIDARGMQWYDTGLYHLQAVQWITRGPMPAGLANLYECLGYNCGWFALAAAIETPLLLGKSCFVVNALFAILIALPAVDALFRLRSDRIFFALLLIPLAQFTIDVPMMSSLSPDPAVMMLVLFSIGLWIRSGRLAAHGFVLACFAVTIKLSALPVLILATIATGRRLPRVAAFCAIAGIIFLARGVWLSGYAAYPAGISRIWGLHWTAPSGIAIHAAKEIEYWSRYGKVFERVVPGSPWFGAWFARVAPTQPMAIFWLLSIMGITLCICRRRFNGRLILAMIALLPALVFWFVTAPQIRFGYGYIFGLASLLFSMGLAGIVIPKMQRSIASIAIFVLLLVMRIDRHFLKISVLNWPVIPTAVLDVHRTCDGIVIHTPRGDDRVWNADLPATTDINPNLHAVLGSDGKIRQWYIGKP